MEPCEWLAGPAPTLCPECESANIRKRADGSWHCERCREDELEVRAALAEARRECDETASRALVEIERLTKERDDARELCRGFARVLLVASLVSTGQVKSTPDLEREVERRITELLAEFRQQSWSKA